jgi:hypothetical protein
MQQAISEARKQAKEGENSWPREQLLWELHPIMQWLIDKVMCRFQRHEAPLILLPQLGKNRAAYLFQGVLSNKRSQPVVAEWFAVHMHPNQSLAVGSFEELLCETGFDQGSPNIGQTSILAEMARSRLGEAVQVAREYVQGLGKERSARLRERIEKDNERFESWYQRSLKQIEEEAARYKSSYEGRIPRDKQERLAHRRTDVEHRRAQRRKWLSDTFGVVDSPYLKLAAVFVGD